MHKINCTLIVIFSIFLSFFVSGQNQEVFEVDPNRELSKYDSIAPIYYKKYGPYLFFTSKPSLDSICCDVRPAYAGIGLWRLDSRNNRVELIIEQFNSNSAANLKSFEIINDRIIYFSGYELMSSDIHGSDRKKLYKLNQSNEKRLGNQMLKFNGYVYFSASELGSLALNLWRTDGTVNGTVKVDLCIGEQCFDSPGGLIESANKMFFVATGSDKKESIWSIDNKHRASYIREALVEWGTELQLTSTGVLFNTPSQPYLTDGTESGTYPLNIDTSISQSVQIDNNIITSSLGLYVIPENGKGEARLIDTSPSVDDLTLFKESLFYISANSILKKSNNSLTDTSTVFEFENVFGSDVKIIAVEGNKLFILRHEPGLTMDKQELWVSDGTTKGTFKLTDFGVIHRLWNFDAWHIFNNALYFSGYSAETGIELWRSDGTIEGTDLAKDIGYGYKMLQHSNIASDGSDVYYLMQRFWYENGHQNTYELWTTNPKTMQSTKISPLADRYVGNIIPSPKGQFFWVESNDFVGVFDLIFYDAISKELTTVNSFIDSHCAGYSFKSIKQVVSDDKFYFQAPVMTGENFSCQLWVSDGTKDGTFALTDLPNTSVQNKIINQLTVYKNEVYFTLNVDIDEYQSMRSNVYKSDGTSAGTGIAFVLPNEGYEIVPYIENITASSEGFFIVTNFYDSENYIKSNLWFWEPESSTKVLANIENLSVFSLVKFKDGIAFSYAGNIWFSDGTTENTSVLIELPSAADNENYISSIYTSPTFEQLIFGSLDDIGKHRVWITDGTLVGTHLVGPELFDNHFTVSAFVGDDFYISDFTKTNDDKLFENIFRYSLNGEEPELIYERLASNENNAFTLVEAQGLIFLGQDIGTYLNWELDSKTPGTGGPYVTARLDDGDIDNDGVMNYLDHLPLHPTEQIDSDLDLIGDNYDVDDDGDYVTDQLDLFPLNATEWADNDNDGIGNVADLDDDNDGVSDWLDSYPLNASLSENSENDQSSGETPPTNNVTPTPVSNNNSASSGGGSLSILLIIFLSVLSIARQSLYVRRK